MDDVQLSLTEHLSELRRRIFISIVAFIIGTIYSYLHVEKIVDFILKPSQGLDFVYLSPPELFLSYIKISAISGAILASPIILFEAWLFIKPGLTTKERRYLLFSMFMAIIFFVIGVIFAYFVIVPITINFFIGMSVKNVNPMLSISNYLSFVSTLLFAFGLIFEFPLLILLLTQLGLITPNTLKQYRKIFILASFIIGAILTPPDVISQVLMALPMILLYEVSIILATLIFGRKSKKQVLMDDVKNEDEVRN